MEKLLFRFRKATFFGVKAEELIINVDHIILVNKKSA